MKKLNVITFLAVLAFAACTTTPKSYVIEGVVPDSSYNNQMVYMYDTEIGIRVDSALVVDGKFTFTGSVDTAVIRRLVLGQLYANLILENGNISVEMDWYTPESAKGTPLNDERSKFQTELAALIKESNKYSSIIIENHDIDEETRNKHLENRNLFIIKIDSLCTVFFLANKNNALGASILSNTWWFLDPGRLDWLYSQAGDIVREYKSLQKVIENNTKGLQFAMGKPFIDFTIENGNIDGSKVSLSDYVGKGKYVLVNFWASWCGPCKAKIPMLIDLYNQYRGDKFEILGVAVWNEREATLKSIENHKIPWPQIIDAGTIPIELYGIRGIPLMILFDPDGKIVTSNFIDSDTNLMAKIYMVMQ